MAGVLCKKFANVLAVEALGSLYRVSQEVLRDLEATPFWSRNLISNTPTSIQILLGEPLEVVTGAEQGAKWAAATVVVAHCTFWDDDRLETLVRLCELLPIGSVVVCITRPIFSSMLQLVTEIQAKTNFGDTSIFILRRVAPAAQES